MSGPLTFQYIMLSKSQHVTLSLSTTLKFCTIGLQKGFLHLLVNAPDLLPPARKYTTVFMLSINCIKLLYSVPINWPRLCIVYSLTALVVMRQPTEYLSDTLQH